MSRWDAERRLIAGVGGMVLSNHNNRIEYAVPPLTVLPEIAAMAKGTPLFVDREIRTGMDTFKALALGASGVCIGRPLKIAIREGRAKHGGESKAELPLGANAQLGKAMAYTGCSDLGRMDPSIIRRF